MNSILNTKGSLLSYKQLRRETALGLHRFKFYDRSDGICRWLNDGEIIEFTAIKVKNNYNAEFEINHDATRQMWLSQFRGIYLNPTKLDHVVVPSHTLNDGTELDFRHMSPMQVWRKISGKRFRVSINVDYPIVIDEWNEKVRALSTTSKVVAYLNENLDSENYDAVHGMTKVARCYELIEV